MRKRFASHFGLTLAFLLIAAPATADESDVSAQGSAAMRIAMDYIDAYGAFDLERVETFYAEDAVFTDPTSFEFTDFGAPYHWEGREAIIRELHELKTESGVVAVTYKSSQVYEASGRVVFVADLQPVYNTKEGVVRTQVPIVTIVTVRNGKVIEHRDYADYDRLRRLDEEQD